MRRIFQSPSPVPKLAYVNVLVFGNPDLLSLKQSSLERKSVNIKSEDEVKSFETQFLCDGVDHC